MLCTIYCINWQENCKLFFFKIYISYHLKISLFLIGFTDKWMSTLFSELLLKSSQAQIPIHLDIISNLCRTQQRNGGARRAWTMKRSNHQGKGPGCPRSPLTAGWVHLFVSLGLLQGIFVTSCKQYRFMHFLQLCNLSRAMQWLMVFLIFRTIPVRGEWETGTNNSISHSDLN